jgi:hypothetical protein
MLQSQRKETRSFIFIFIYVIVKYATKETGKDKEHTS